ncbi:BCCT family transporter [Desulfobacula toluolica]|uniref:OpuD: glycine betaine transporter n=1 Tax=Desulfobacula toluolica (strain DSM 7467 / Tol2) TaxID=651182 RepID=K0NEP0_DESTT|nr:BCCT family transporter [Desulfobacula toluolica]CCK79395.1 OpuD: glycine betaine transporter [Desulfobacula toluolica Tol2]
MTDKKIPGIKRLFGKEIDTRVLYGATALALPFIILGFISPAMLGKAGSAALDLLTGSFSWLYLMSCSFFVVAVIGIALSPLGKIKLGRDDETPEFSFLSWFAMLFSAGMGIGLIFWSCSEPMYHFMSPPAGEAGTAGAARQAFEIFFFHWGLHAWATYIVVGLPMAYFTFRKGRPATISSCIGTGPDPKKNVALGNRTVNILAIWATIMGVVTSLGMGAIQINSGLSHSMGISTGPVPAAIIIAVITIVFILSALTGVAKGIRILSLINVTLMVVLLLFFFVLGPFKYILHTFFQALTDYAKDFVSLSTSFVLFDNPGWTKSWTVFYWAWWIAWAPFVGAFIARISRGRTIRQFILVILLAPTLFSYVFSTALGGTAIYLDLFTNTSIGEAVKQSVEVALFETLSHLPLYGLLVFFTNVLIASFFITSADSATYVISRYSTAGLEPGNPRAGKRLIIFWGTILGGLAIVLIFSGGLSSLQTASIVGAFPFLIIMFILLFVLIKELIKDYKSIPPTTVI